MNGAQTTQPTTSKPAMTQVNTDVTLGGLFVTQDSHDTHMAARTDWVNHDWGSDASRSYVLWIGKNGAQRTEI